MANGQKHPRQAIEPSAFGISLSKGNGRPLFMQLHEQIIARISARELMAGARLPPVRRLAEQLGINHMTVAKDDVLDEGVTRLCSVAKDLMRPRSVPSPIFT